MFYSTIIDLLSNTSKEKKREKKKEVKEETHSIFNFNWSERKKWLITTTSRGGGNV